MHNGPAVAYHLQTVGEQILAMVGLS